jgi:hypothetical protein
LGDGTRDLADPNDKFLKLLLMGGEE